VYIFLIKIVKSLVFLGLLNPLDAPHHLRQDEESEYREGIVLDRPVKSGCGSFVNAGLKKVKIDNIKSTLNKLFHHRKSK